IIHLFNYQPIINHKYLLGFRSVCASISHFMQRVASNTHHTQSYTTLSQTHTHTQSCITHTHTLYSVCQCLSLSVSDCSRLSCRLLRLSRWFSSAQDCLETDRPDHGRTPVLRQKLSEERA